MMGKGRSFWVGPSFLPFRGVSTNRMVVVACGCIGAGVWTGLVAAEVFGFSGGECLKDVVELFGLDH